MSQHKESIDAPAPRRAPRIHSWSPIVPVAAVFLLLATVSSATAQSCVQPPGDIIAWWPGDTDGRDISGKGSDAQLQNGATAGVAGHTRGAFQFDGVDDIA